jgi:hypothetical protein
MKSVSGPTIKMANEQYWDFLDPVGSAKRVDVLTIFQALSNICRFTGHCNEFYSVAEHSYYCSKLVPPELAWDALMHDAAEAFLGDVSRPLKALLPEYKALEQKTEDALAERFNLRRPLPPEIKHADRQMLALEQQTLFRKKEDWKCLEGVEIPRGVHICRWSPCAAINSCIARAYDLKRSGLIPPGTNFEIQSEGEVPQR